MTSGQRHSSSLNLWIEASDVLSFGLSAKDSSMQITLDLNYNRLAHHCTEHLRFQWEGKAIVTF
jgi:hypothetical protein